MDMNQYMTERVEDQLGYYEKAANKAKNAHIRTQTAVIILGLLVPVVTNLPQDWGNGLNGEVIIRYAVTIMSLLLAVLTGISNFRKYGDLWLTYRRTEELIKHEKYLFLTSSGQYSKREAAESNFVQTVESIISAEHNKFRSIIEESKRPVADSETKRNVGGEDV